MYKDNYIRILFFIEDTTANNGKFDFDRALDGTYNFNVRDVSNLYDLVSTIEAIAAEHGILQCTKQEDSLLKEFKYKFNSKIYNVSRYYTHDEYSYITRYAGDDDGGYVPEKDLMEQVEAKCKLMEDRINMIYRERTGSNFTG